MRLFFLERRIGILDGGTFDGVRWRVIVGVWRVECGELMEEDERCVVINADCGPEGVRFGFPNTEI